MLSYCLVHACAKLSVYLKVIMLLLEKASCLQGGVNDDFFETLISIN